MIKRPICLSTSQPCNSFCSTPKCQQPAFCCSNICLLAHPHGRHRLTTFWSDIANDIIAALSFAPQASDQPLLQTQSKIIKRLIGRLQTMQEQNKYALIEIRSKAKYSEQAEKVVKGLSTGETAGITGGDMYVFRRLIVKRTLVVNQEELEREIADRHRKVFGVLRMVEKALEGLRVKKEADHQEEVQKLPKSFGFEEGEEPIFHNQRRRYVSDSEDDHFVQQSKEMTVKNTEILANTMYRNRLSTRSETRKTFGDTVKLVSIQKQKKRNIFQQHLDAKLIKPSIINFKRLQEKLKAI